MRSNSGPVAGLALLAVAMLAGAVHIVSLLAMPFLATENAYARLARLAPESAVTVLPPAGRPEDPLPGRDPAAATAVCRYDLGRGPLRVTAALGEGLYAALSLHSRTGVAFYGLNDRAENDGRMELVVMTAAQLAGAISQESPGAPVRDVRVQAPEPLGFVSFDVLPRIGGYDAALAGLGSMRCEVERQP